MLTRIFVTDLFRLCLDDAKLFVPHDSIPNPQLKMVRQWRVANLPCRTTSPNVSVTLWKGTTQWYTREDLTYDTRSGFTIKFPNVYTDGQFFCKASHENVTDSLSFVLRFVGRPMQRYCRVFMHTISYFT